MVDVGRDGASEKRRERAEASAAITFRELAEDYLQLHSALRYAMRKNY